MKASTNSSTANESEDKDTKSGQTSLQRAFKSAANKLSSTFMPPNRKVNNNDDIGIGSLSIEF